MEDERKEREWGGGGDKKSFQWGGGEYTSISSAFALLPSTKHSSTSSVTVNNPSAALGLATTVNMRGGKPTPCSPVLPQVLALINAFFFFFLN